MRVQEVRDHIKAGDYKKALSGAKDFHLGVSKEQRSVMARAYESYIRPEFYRSIGKNPDNCIQAGIVVLLEVLN